MNFIRMRNSGNYTILWFEFSKEYFDCWDISMKSVSGYHSLYQWYKQVEGEHFPDPTGLRSRIEQWTFGLYPACIKYLMSAFDVPEVTYLSFKRYDLYLLDIILKYLPVTTGSKSSCSHFYLLYRSIYFVVFLCGGKYLARLWLWVGPIFAARGWSHFPGEVQSYIMLQFSSISGSSLHRLSLLCSGATCTSALTGFTYILTRHSPLCELEITSRSHDFILIMMVIWKSLLWLLTRYQISAIYYWSWQTEHRSTIAAGWLVLLLCDLYHQHSLSTFMSLIMTSRYVLVVML